MAIEIISDKKIEDISKKREVIHVCAEYNEGDPMTSEFNGKRYEFELHPCSDCGCKITMTKGYPLMKAK